MARDKSFDVWDFRTGPFTRSNSPSFDVWDFQVGPYFGEADLVIVPLTASVGVESSVSGTLLRFVGFASTSSVSLSISGVLGARVPLNASLGCSLSVSGDLTVFTPVKLTASLSHSISLTADMQRICGLSGAFAPPATRSASVFFV